MNSWWSLLLLPAALAIGLLAMNVKYPSSWDAHQGHRHRRRKHAHRK